MHYTIVITSLNGAEVLPVCLDALYKTKWDDFDVILVDNGSTDNTSEVVKKGWPEVKIIRSERNLGFAGGNNLGIKAARGDWIILLNDDTETAPDWLNALNEAAAKYPNAGILGCKLLYPGGEIIQHAGGFIEPNGLTGHFGYEEKDQGQYDDVRSCDYITGAAMAISRKTIETVGILDPGYFPIYFEEIDYCTRAKKASFDVLYIPDARIIHHESRTTNKYSPGFLYKYHKNRLRYLFKNKSFKGLLKAFRHETSWLIRHRPRDTYAALVKSWIHILPRIPGILLHREKKYQ